MELRPEGSAASENRCARCCVLRMIWPRQDHPKLEKFVRRTLDVGLQEEELCALGVNWGEIQFNQGTLKVLSAGQKKDSMNGVRMLDINLNTVEKVLPVA